MKPASPLAFRLRKTWAGPKPEWIVTHPAGYGVASFGEREYDLARWEAEYREAQAVEFCRVLGITPAEFIALASARFDAFLVTMTGDVP